MDENPYKAPTDTAADRREVDESASMSIERLGGIGCTVFIMTIVSALVILRLLALIYR